MPAKIWILLGVLLILSPWCFIAFFAHPIADDYCYANVSRTSFLFQEYCKQYMTWNGRYSSNLFVLLNPILHNLFLYQLLSLFLLIFTWFSYFIFIKTLLKESQYSRWSGLISLTLVELYLFQMPSVAEGFYWYTGAITYQAANALALIYFAMLIQFARRQYFISKPLHLLLSGLLLVFIIGFNETVLLFLAGMHWLLIVAILKNEAIRKEFSTVIVFLFLICVVAAGVVILAPGNAVRSSFFPGNHELMHSLMMGIFQTLRFSSDWISNLPFIGLSVLVFPLMKRLSTQDTLFARLFVCPIGISTALLLLIVFAGVFPAYWNTRILGQYRTVNAAYFFFIPAWFFNLGCWSRYIAERQITFSFSMGKNARFLLFLLVVLAMAFTKNGYFITTDLLYQKVNAFDSEMRMRNALMNAAANKGIQAIDLPPLKSKPNTLFVQDLNPDSMHWINTSYAAFFGMKTVVLKK
jgi:hypothetical protein